MPPVDQHLLAKLRLQGRTLVDDAGRVAVDAPCRGCGYNLRGLPAEGTCPECGHAVADALRDDRPEHSDPLWLRAVVLGGNLLAWAGATLIACVLILFFAAIFAAGLPRTAGQTMLGVIFILILFAATLALAGVWCLTRPEAGDAGRPHQAHYRWTARVGLTATGIALLTSVLFNRLAPQSHRSVHAVIEWLTLTFPVVCLGAGLFGLLMYLRLLALRMMEWEQARSYKTVATGLVVASCLYLLIMVAVTPQLARGTAYPLLCCGLDLLLASYFGLWGIALADQTRRALNAAYQRAKWAEEDA